MHNTGRECLRSGGVSNHAPLKVDSDIKSACGKEEYSPQQLDGWIIHLCSVEMSRGVRRSWLITPLALGLVTTFPQLFICKTWRCLGFPFVDWCVLCTRLNLDLQKLRSWMLSLHSWGYNEILEGRLAFGASNQNLAADVIDPLSLCTIVDRCVCSAHPMLWLSCGDGCVTDGSQWESLESLGKACSEWWQHVVLKDDFNAQVNDVSFLHPIHPDFSVLCWDCNPAVNLI